MVLTSSAKAFDNVNPNLWVTLEGESSQKSLAPRHGACFDANATAVTQPSSDGLAAVFLVLKSGLCMLKADLAGYVS